MKEPSDLLLKLDKMENMNLGSSLDGGSVFTILYNKIIEKLYKSWPTRQVWRNISISQSFMKEERARLYIKT